jgi:flavin reductase (DIM6/NTAB) family NADH-FMN oxidoreductase RutF
MAWYNNADAQQWERYYRANMISGLSGYKAAMLVATVNEDASANLALFQNIVHVGTNPALIGMINRPEAATPHTLNNIRRTRFFTLNTVQQAFVAQAHQASAAYQQDEFEATGLQKQWIDQFPVPFVAASAIKVGLSLVEIMPIRINQTFFIIGQVECFYVPDDLLKPDGYINLAAADVVCTSGLDGYALP